MIDYTLSSYKKALEAYDQNVEKLKDRSLKEIQDLTEVFYRTQKDVENDQFLPLSEKSRMLRKRQEGFDKIKKEKEGQLKVALEAVSKKKEEFMAQNGGFDYHCFKTLSELRESKEEEQRKISLVLKEKQEELARLQKEKQEELVRLQKEIEVKHKEENRLILDLNAIQTGTLHETFFQLDVKPRIKKVESDLKNLEGKKGYNLSKDFADRIIRYLTKECEKQNKKLKYEGGKLELSFDTVENWTKGESEALRRELDDILTNRGFVISKMEGEKNEKFHDAGRRSSTFTLIIRDYDRVGIGNLYWKNYLERLDKNDIQGRVNVFKGLGFSFANEGAFIKQVETARGEGVDLVEDIDRWIQLYLVKSGAIEPRMSDDKKQYFKISLDCRQRNPRILMTMDPSVGMKILCVAPHVDYDNILRGQTKNYFQTWKGDWIKKGKQGRKTGRA